MDGKYRKLVIKDSVHEFTFSSNKYVMSRNFTNRLVFAAENFLTGVLALRFRKQRHFQNGTIQVSNENPVSEQSAFSRENRKLRGPLEIKEHGNLCL